MRAIKLILIFVILFGIGNFAFDYLRLRTADSGMTLSKEYFTGVQVNQTPAAPPKN